MLLKHEVHKIEEKYYDNFPAIKLVTISREDIIANKSSSNRSIQPRNFPSHEAYCKQLIMFRCKNPKPCELPYSIEQVDARKPSAAEIWYHALTRSNPPEERIFVYNEEFLEEVKKLDFGYFDEFKAKELQAKFSAAKRKSVIDIDAEQIEMGDEEEGACPK